TRYPLWLFDEEITWQARYVSGGTIVDVLDRDALVAAARELAATTTVRGVFSWDEMLIVNTAYVAAALDLPGAGVDGVEGCRDKARNRRVLAGAGLAQPQFGFVTDQAQAVAVADRIGYPVVVKPRGLGASIGVALAADAAEVRAAFRTADTVSRLAAPAYEGSALIEEYLPGPEFAIDGAVVDGQYTPLYVAQKIVGMHPYFEELGHVVNPDDEMLSDSRLLASLALAHHVIDFRNGITHTEVKLTGRGPVIVEINGRLAGDFIPLLARYASGIEPGAAAVDVAMGRPPRLPDRTRHDHVGIRFAYPPRACVVESVSVPEPCPEDGVLATGVLVDPGATLELPPVGFIPRHAYVICAGRDSGECVALLEKTLSDVRLTSRPLR
ncbi:MAG TPA: ATP-grasp domain-containing protein, partial [Streptosporangiaceae bacterium]|nr:ATP-grasp domain-containing protein [Streptosporangiaceae bacterium]